MGDVSEPVASVLGILLVLATLALVLSRGGVTRLPSGEKWRLALVWAAIFAIATLAAGVLL